MQDSGFYACLFAYPYDTTQKTFVPRVVARDLAGNERQAGIYYRAKDKTFRRRQIKISDSFLAQKVPEFESIVSEPGEPIDIFLAVNGEIRKQNRALIAELGQKTAPTPLWEGPFQRQPKPRRWLNLPITGPITIRGNPSIIKFTWGKIWRP